MAAKCWRWPRNVGDGKEMKLYVVQARCEWQGRETMYPAPSALDDLMAFTVYRTKPKNCQRGSEGGMKLDWYCSSERRPPNRAGGFTIAQALNTSLLRSGEQENL
jgi:hypothetical protein